MRIIGIDMSLTGTGISDGSASWVISSAPAGQDLAARHARLETMLAKITQRAVAGFTRGADLVVVEAPVFGGASGRGAFVLERSALWWLVVAWFLERNVPIAEVTASSVKFYATGKGNASKALMIDQAARRLPDVETGADDNRVDALWLSAMGHDHAGQPLVTLPAAQRKALDKVRWPGELG